MEKNGFSLLIYRRKWEITTSLLQKEGAKFFLFPEEREKILSSHYNHLEYK